MKWQSERSVLRHLTTLSNKLKEVYLLASAKAVFEKIQSWTWKYCLWSNWCKFLVSCNWTL